MSGDPLDIAIKEISETKNLLAALITSSESFDYPTAKKSLVLLQRKLRELGKLQRALTDQAEVSRCSGNVQAVDFQAVPRNAVDQS
jgi:hypothetical protein